MFEWYRITFEIVEESNNKHIAKENLFKHIARAKDFKAKHIDALYLIPEVCSFNGKQCNIYNSRLYYIDLNNKDTNNLTKNEYYGIVNSIYDNIYTESYRVSEPNLVKQHAKFAKQIMQRIKREVPTKNRIDLK